MGMGTAGEFESVKVVCPNPCSGELISSRASVTVLNSQKIFNSAFNQVKALLTNAERCVISSKEKTGCINVHLKEGEYFLDLKCNIPNSYPEHGVDVCLKEGNLPSSVQGTILQQAQEKARRLSEAPKVAQVVGGAVGREGAGSGEGSKSEKLSQNQTLSSRKMTGNLQVRCFVSQLKGIYNF